MAKWGEGDPRWIVEERPDAVNVNNWHWTEKNACDWSKSKFKQLFTDFKIVEDGFRMRITEVEKAEGEANANNRKGKLIFFYEWELTLKWRGRVNGSDEYVSGKIVIPNLSEENDLHEIEVEISVNEKTKEAQKMKELIYANCRDKIRAELGKYITCLKDEFSQGMILPKKDTDNQRINNTTTTMNTLTSGLESKVQVTATEKLKTATNNTGAKLNLSNLDITAKFQCTNCELYNALTLPELVGAFTQGPVKLDLRPGGAFEFFGGNIVGEFVELVPNERIVQKWRVKRWPAGVFSTVTIDLKQESDHTLLKLHQAGLPATEVDSTRENWERYYWESLKRTFAFGYFL